jgi:hypothetical protein
MVVVMVVTAAPTVMPLPAPVIVNRSCAAFDIRRIPQPRFARPIRTSRRSNSTAKMTGRDHIRQQD